MKSLVNSIFGLGGSRSDQQKTGDQSEGEIDHLLHYSPVLDKTIAAYPLHPDADIGTEISLEGAADSQAHEATKAQLAEVSAKLAFARTTEDYDLESKQKRIIDGLEDFGSADFAEISAWLFASSLTNHRIIHQRIDESSLLWRAVKMSEGPILEVGRAAGGSTVCILAASGNRKVVSIDRFPQHADVSDYVFARPDVERRLELLTQSSRDPIPEAEYGIMFIDGDHSYEGVCHDIATFWNQLKPQNGKPAFAVFHDAAENPISYVEPVRMACAELISEPGVARVIDHWGSMMLVEKIEDVDPAKWYAKVDTEFWQSLTPRPEFMLAPTTIRKSLNPEARQLESIGQNLVSGDNFDDTAWTLTGLAKEQSTAYGADNPLRILKQTTDFSRHAISTQIQLPASLYCFTSYIRPIGVPRVRLGVFTTKGAELACVEFAFSGEGQIENPFATGGVSIIDAEFIYRNGFFRCDIKVLLPSNISVGTFELQAMDDNGNVEFQGDAELAFAINAASVRELGGITADEARRSAAVDSSASENLLEAQAERFQTKITRDEVLMHGSPHMVIDDLFTEDFLASINHYWPAKDRFSPELEGSEFFGLYRKEYDGFTGPAREFWIDFNEEVAPKLIARIADAFLPFLVNSFGDLALEDISTHGSVLLMEQGPGYQGQGMHTHFYHNPNWIFTVLIYVGDESVDNPGTTLYSIRPDEQVESSNIESNYSEKNLDWRVQRAMNLAADENSVYKPITAEYKKNRVLTFVDGPMAHHAVEPPAKGGVVSHRRLIRAHVKLPFDQFLQRTSAPCDETKFVRIMDPTVVDHDDEEIKYRETYIRQYYADRISAYARALEGYKDANIPAAESHYPHIVKQIKASVP